MIETLMPWTPLVALVVVFVGGFLLAWWLRSEDAAQYKAELRRRAASYDEMSAHAVEAAALYDAAREEIAALKRGWQTVRAAVEQHTVASK